MIKTNSQNALNELRLHQIELEMQNESLRCTQLALDKLRAAYFNLYDKAPVGYLTLNKEWRIIESNHAAADLLGVLYQDLAKHPLSDYIISEDQDIFYKHRKQLINTGLPQTCELRMLKNDGDSIWIKFDSLATNANDNDVYDFKVVLSDISICKKAEEKISLFFDLIPDMLCVAGFDGYFKRINKSWESTLGYSQEELLTTPIIEFIHPDDKNATIDEDDKQRVGIPVLNYNNRYRCKDGSYRWLEWTSVPSINSSCIFAVARDITRRIELEVLLQKNFEFANTANKTMTRLLRTIAHEFLTPIGLLIGSTDILDKYWDKLTPEKRFEQNEHIRNASKQLSNMFNSILSFNELGEDLSVCNVFWDDIGEKCSSIAKEVEMVWGNKHKFVIIIATDCGTVKLDETLFRRVLENLLTNAFKYTPSGNNVSLHLCREKNDLMLEVTDNGIGIPIDDQKLIFDAFYRSSNVEGGRGLGLGLAIVSESLIKMGGTINVDSTIGKGTTMKVKIPIGD